MSNNQSLLKQAKSTKGSVNHSEPTKGGGMRLPEVGKCPARLVGYIELGTHPQGDYKGQAKSPEMEVQLVFECFGKNNMDEIEVDGKKKIVGRIVRPFPMSMKVNERAKFYKLFKDMDYNRGLDHMYHMLDDVFRLTISHGVAKGSGNPYASIDIIESPLIEKVDPETGDVVGHTDITNKVPPASYPLQLFLVENPTFEQWDSIEIEGTYKKKTKNEKTGEEIEEEVSSNFIQQKIKDALDWEGSAMQTLLLGLDDQEEEPKEEEVEEEVTKAPVKKTVAKKDAGPAPQKKTSTKSKATGSAGSATTSPSDDADDMLAELGLD